ncbi:MAG: glycosyltransferase family 39 protein [Thermodesulfobacteriota bacterium]
MIGSRGRVRLLAGILLAVFAGLAFSSALQESATWDETHYLGLGRVLLTDPRWDAPSAILHPPLSYYVHSLPLLLCRLDLSCFDPTASGIRRGRCLLRGSEPSGDRLLLLARLPIIGLGVVLGWIVYLWAAALYGPSGGLLSLFLYCLNPDLLAHSGLITPDLCLTAFGFLTVYLFWRCLMKPTPVRIALCGLMLGLTLLSKYAGLIWAPMLALLSLLAVLCPGAGFAKGGQSYLRLRPMSSMVLRPFLVLGIVAAVGFLVLLAAYRFDLTPYLAGIEAQRAIVGEGRPAFMNGRVSSQGGWWYFYLYAFAVKEPIPLLLLMLGAALAGKGTRQVPGDVLWLGIPAVVVFASFSFLTETNLGIRYVLPAFPFLLVFAGRVSHFWNRKWKAAGIVVPLLMLWYALESLSVSPHYLAYFNQVAGGPKNGYRHLVDSNLDWGQDLKGLKRYMDRNGLETIKLSYFGTADPRQYGIEYEALPSFVPLPKRVTRTPLRKGDLVAVSATNLYPLYVDLGELGAHLRSISPVAYMGYSILIYRLERNL